MIGGCQQRHEGYPYPYIHIYDEIEVEEVVESPQEAVPVEESCLEGVGDGHDQHQDYRHGLPGVMQLGVGEDGTSAVHGREHHQKRPVLSQLTVPR